MSVLFGDRPPTGRLPVTIYDENFIAHRNSSAHNITDMSLRSVDGLTYMHYTGTPLWPFGFGLSYTTWSISATGRRTGTVLEDAVRETSNGGLTVTTVALAVDYAAYYRPPVPAPAVMSTSVAVAVTNTGKRMSGVVVHVYATTATPLPAGSAPPPRRCIQAHDTQLNTVALCPAVVCTPVSAIATLLPHAYCCAPLYAGMFVCVSVSVCGDVGTYKCVRACVRVCVSLWVSVF